MTYDQHTASDPQLSAWVSASAGTGKTKVLTDRVLRLLLDGAHPDKILCITYTKAASAEIESRIEARLGEWAMMPEAALSQALQTLTGSTPAQAMLTRARQLFARVIDAPQRLRIQTIHGFCQSVLMRFPLEAQVAPHFTLIDERTSQELLRDARLRLLQNENCAQAIAALGTLISEGTLSELLEDIVSARRKFAPWLENKAQLQARIYAVLGVEQGLTAEALVARHMRYTPEEEASLRRICAALLQSDAVSDTTMGNGLAAWLEHRTDYEAYILTFLTREGLPRKHLGTQKAEKACPGAKALLQAEQRRVVAFADQLQAMKVAQASVHIATLAQVLLTLYREQKSLHGYMDYDDLIAHTVRLLQRESVAPWVLYKLDGGIDHILVDEAQDTSPEQWMIVEALADEFFAGESARRAHRTLFVVGDEKQSIFSFQGAEPAQFDDVQQRLSQHITAAGAQFKRVRLALSFRSAAPVLKAVDEVFAQVDARDGLVFAESDISHDVNRKNAAGCVELWPLVQGEAAEATGAWHIPERHHYSPSAQQLCANQIADTIAQWLAEKRILASKGRAVTPGDILILVQRRGGFAGAMLRALKRKGVAVAGADRLVLTEHIGVMDCMALAEFLLQPHDDLTLATVLKSPLIGISEDALFTLAHGRSETLWQRAKGMPETQMLSDLLARTDYMPPFELFMYALEACGGRAKLAARLGAEVDDPLNEFLSLALQYQQAHTPSLQGFMHWLKAEKTEIKRDMEKGRDEVRIMTVHAAKGLEAPIVFLADTTRTPVPARSNRPLWLQENPAVPLWSPFSDYDDSRMRTLREHYKLEAAREYRRLLYVAMTRAQDELYICGWKGARAVSEECWYELLRRGAQNWQTEGDKKILTSAQTEIVKPAQAVPRQKTAPLPCWAHRALADEVAAEHFTASRAVKNEKFTLNKDAKARERGIVVHRLLQYLPDVPEAHRGAAVQHFIQRYGGSLSQQEQQALEKEVLAILHSPGFAPVFSADSVAEVPVCGSVKDTLGNNVTISGQIDRLALVGNSVYIVDYKTARDVPAREQDVPQGYLQQMQAYRSLVQRIYPGRAIYCALLWTAKPCLMPLSDSVLALAA